jgi:hypothetical protein
MTMCAKRAEALRPTRRRVLTGLGLGLLAGCVPEGGTALVPPAPSPAEQQAQVAAVTVALRGLSPSVSPAEAARAAHVAVTQPLVWAREWRVVDPPLAHNVKVVHGIREKGVCQDWADAMEIALTAERFRTLQLHRAIANARNILLEHATVIVTARGQPMEQGIILDPWRIGQGRLYFGPVLQDDRYVWESREAVRAWKRDWHAEALTPQ